ncbi:EAL domain-containing protein [Clostridium baratii]|uniref:EAL domain-containing protein n=1 Tax=Clostridium baratii TaxID=1561 RepID=UPI0006C0968C|nr:GGDEF domain-containing phosphodiesterase [Clostridium baratii]MDU1054027.1 GGDEF domain-containing phosphodiesterase [Clostridium baratii]MDU4911096.1 GGDEF domain-containing phosphodiesterase [Clostridium baratii]CUP48430.1 diguanylate cyclase (GGDEF) domain-containing protein [Clostridium baratii]
MGNYMLNLVKMIKQSSDNNSMIVILSLLILALIWGFISLMNKRTNEKYRIVKSELETVVSKNENIDFLTINLKSGKVTSKKNFELLYNNSNGIVNLHNFLKAISLSKEELDRIIGTSSEKGYFEFEYSVKKENEDRFIRAYSHIVNSSKLDLILCDVTRDRVGNISYVHEEGIDVGTGLVNKLNYKKEIRKLIDDYRVAYGVLLFIEINDFEINKNLYGDEFMDNLIKIISAKLKGYIDDKTVAFKFSGPNFGIYKHGFNKRKGMDSFFNDVKEKLTFIEKVNGTNINISCNIGSSILNFDVASEEELYNYAEFAMKEGRKLRSGFETNINHFNKSDYEKYRKVNKKLNRVLKVIEEKKYYSVFQPIVSLSDMSLYGVEGLTRIQDRSFRNVIDFFNVAKIKNLEDYVSMKFGVNIYCDYIKASLPKDVKIFINETFNEERIKGRVEYSNQINKELEDRNIYADKDENYNNVVIEFSERSTYGFSEEVDEIIKLYRKNDILIAIDDFGAGYANEGLILKLKPDIVKLDRELICSIDKDDYRRTLTTNTIKTLKKLGVKIVAEGIETKEEFDFLRNLGVDYGQGYYIQKPTSIDELRLSYKDILS